MNRRMMMERAARSLETEIMNAFLEDHGLGLEDCDPKDLLKECREDYLEFRKWYMACRA